MVRCMIGAVVSTGFPGIPGVPGVPREFPWLPVNLCDFPVSSRGLVNVGALRLRVGEWCSAGLMPCEWVGCGNNFVNKIEVL